MFNSFLVTIASFIFTLGLLIAIHEYGHFQVARWCGVKVLRFSIGFGKPFFTRRIGQDQTEFALAAIPLGGYVKMLDEREAPVEDVADLPRAFNRQAVWKKILIVLAGPVANLLLAILLFWGLFMAGVTGLKPILSEMPVESAAAKAQLYGGDMITSIQGQPVANWQDVRWLLLQEVLNTSAIEIKSLDTKGVSHVHQLDVSGITKDDLEGDFLAKLGLTPFKPNLPATIGEVLPNSAADKAGLKTQDRVVSIAGHTIQNWEALVDKIRLSPNQALNFAVIRDGQTLHLKVVPELIKEQDKSVGRIGASFYLPQSEINKLITTTSYPPMQALVKAIQKTWDTAIFSLKMLGKMLVGDVSLKSVSGPVTIASFAGQSANVGVVAFVGFLALISISLGVLNLLPIPILDGGHLLYYIVEIIKGSPVSEQAMEIGQRIGMSLLGGLMIIAFYNDINRLITG